MLSSFVSFKSTSSLLVELAYTVVEEAFQLNESQTDVKNFLPLFVVLCIKLFKHYIEG